MGAEATACRLPAPALPTRSPCPTLGRPDAARRSTSVCRPSRPSRLCRYATMARTTCRRRALRTAQLGVPALFVAFRRRVRASEGWCAVRCHSNLWSSVRVRLARPCLTQPAPWGKRSFAQTSGQSSYPRETASQRQRVDPVLPRKTVGPSRTASRSLCIARTSIGCVLCHGSRWTRTSFFSVSADMFTRAGNTAVQDRGRLAARRPARGANGSNASGRAEPAPQQACRFTTRDSDTAQIRS